MRLRELRRLQTRQKGGSGLPRELPRLSPKVTMDIGGTVFGRLRGGSYPNLEETWSPKQSQTGDCVLSQKHSKTFVLFRFWGSFSVLEGQKIETLQQAAAERSGDAFKMRLRELRRFQTRQKGGSGLPKELPRLSPIAMEIIDGTASVVLTGGGPPRAASRA